MPPKRKAICDCGTLERASKEADHPIRWDERMNEYYVAVGSGGRMMVYYCPICGGSTPKSRRSSFFAHVSQAEETRLYELFQGIRTVDDVIARFGPPDRELETGAAVRYPGKEGKPERGEAFRSLVYQKLSPVADVYFDVGTNSSARGHWIQKYLKDGNG